MIPQNDNSNFNNQSRIFSFKLYHLGIIIVNILLFYFVITLYGTYSIVSSRFDYRQALYVAVMAHFCALLIPLALHALVSIFQIYGKIAKVLNLIMLLLTYTGFISLITFFMLFHVVE